ncbi:unnamed protein product, partial [Meganyctiphanes norvegica]
RWKCFILMYIYITVSSGLPQNSANTSVAHEAEGCPFDEFQCHGDSGNCIRGSWKCDGEDDCTDGSDEKDCFNAHKAGPECKFGSFMCLDGSNHCIRKSWRCDGEDDCSDGSDEKNCHAHKMPHARCPSGQFMCQDGSERCIRGSWRCDGDYDCKDGSDEKSCYSTSLTCPSGEFMCKDSSRRCIRNSWRCDGDDDCSDGSDEKNCYNTDPMQQIHNISYSHGFDYISQDNESKFQTFENLRNIVERLIDQQEPDRSRIFFGCTSDMKQAFSECLAKCSDVTCTLQELQNFLSSCNSGTKQTCSPPPGCECGVPNPLTGRRIGGTPTNPSDEPTRIVGGIEVVPERKYPWQVALISDDQIICGGTIINDRWILTAAHCLIGLDDCESPLPSTTGLKVRVGEHDQSSITDDDPDNTKDYAVTSYVAHPDFECAGVLNNDFALLELEQEIPFNSVIRPVCLPEDDSKTYAGVTATVSGWGHTTNGGLSADVLMEVDVPIDAQADCRGDLGPFEDTKICAGPLPGKDSCQGDSGGPLVVKEDDKYIQVGIVSYGPACGDETNSAIYARVSKVLDWISDTTASGKSCK